MSLLNEKHDKIVCISLLEREDKYKFMLAQFIKYDIEVEWFRPVISGYAAQLTKPYGDIHNNWAKNYVLFNPQFPNEFGCMQSHYHVIKTAFLEGVENLFVFEDDCAFHKDWNNLLPKYFDTIPENTDGILLYSYMDRLLPENIRIKPRWTKGYASWSFIAYGLNRKAMEGYIKLQDNTPMIADRGSWTMMTHLNFNFVVASPPLVLPRKDFSSNIRGEKKNYDKSQFLGGNIFMLGINEQNYE